MLDSRGSMGDGGFGAGSAPNDGFASPPSGFGASQNAGPAGAAATTGASLSDEILRMISHSRCQA